MESLIMNVALVCSLITNVILGLVIHGKSKDHRLTRVNERLTYAIMAKSLEDYGNYKAILDEDAGERYDRIVKENEGIEAAAKQMESGGIPVQ